MAGLFSTPQSSAVAINALNSMGLETALPATPDTSPAAMAARLINTKSLPAGLGQVQAYAREAQAYHVQEPYPLWYFKDWKTEERGPLPKCMPTARRIIMRGAKWLFGTPPSVTCAANTPFEQFVLKMWKANRLSIRLPNMAERASIEGGIALKFDYDVSRKSKPVNIEALSVVDQVRLYYDPFETDRLLMARIQMPYFDAAEGVIYWRREEWTAEEYVTYEPLADTTFTAQVAGVTRNPDAFEGWEIKERVDNEFGVIPIALIKNIEAGDVWGEGDLWTLYRIIDRINLTYHLMDRSNQFDSETNPIFQDLEISDDDLNVRQQPGQPMSVQSTNGAEGKAGTVHFPRGGNNLRPAMMDYAKDLRRQVNTAAGSVDVDPGDVTNKGNLTEAVLTQLYQPQIEMTNQKRLAWGDDGLVRFFSLIGKALTNAGVTGFHFNDEKEDDYTVNLKWGPYFTKSENEKTSIVGRIQLEESVGYTTRDRAIEEVAEVEGRDDVEQLKTDLKAEGLAKAKAAADALKSAQQGGEADAEAGGAGAAPDAVLAAVAGEIKEIDRMGGPEAQ